VGKKKMERGSRKRERKKERVAELLLGNLSLKPEDGRFWRRLPAEKRKKNLRNGRPLGREKNSGGVRSMKPTRRMWSSAGTACRSVREEVGGWNRKKGDRVCGVELENKLNNLREGSGGFAWGFIRRKVDGPLARGLS